MKNKVLLGSIMLLLLFTFTGFAQSTSPTNLTATVNAAGNAPSISLAWQYDSASRQTKYAIYKKVGMADDTTTQFVKIWTTGDKRFNDFYVLRGKTYSYYVTAVKQMTESSPSNTVEASVPQLTFGIIDGLLVKDSADALPLRGKVKFIPATTTGGELKEVRTDSNGYFKAKLKTGSYIMFFVAEGYVAEYYDNVATAQGATVVALNTDDSLSYSVALVKIQPPTYGIISGTVTNDATAEPVKRGMVNIFPVQNTAGKAVNVMIDSNGNFKAKVRTGQYYMYFSAHGFIPEYFENAATFDLATAVTVNANDSLGFAIGMAAPVPPTFYTLTGWVKDAADAPVRASVTAYLSNRNGTPGENRRKLSSLTDSLGNYALTLKAGDTVVLFAGSNKGLYLPEYWDNKRTFNEADRIAVNGNLTDINITLDAKPVYANGITGTVKDSAGELALKSEIFAYKKMNTRSGFIRYSAKTDTLTGEYAFGNLEPGTYVLLAHSGGYKPTYFRFDFSPTMDWRNADTIVVAADAVVPNVDFRLRARQRHTAGTSIFGTIKSKSGIVIDGALAYAVTVDGEYAGSAVSDLDGSYAIEGLTAGTYTVVSTMVSYLDGSANEVSLFTESESKQADITMGSDEVTGVSGNGTAVAGQYRLQQNYPNPFNPGTVISYSLPARSYVSLKVYNILGNEVATLVDGMQDAGEKSFSWNAGNLPSGVYMYKLTTPSFSEVKRMMLVK